MSVENGFGFQQKLFNLNKKAIKIAFQSYSATSRQEPNLKEYFVETASIQKIKSSRNICVISGLKGIGKTATFRNLTEFDTSTDLIVDISANEYSHPIVNTDQRAITFSHEFEYEIAIEFLQKLIKRKDLHKKINSDDLSAAKKYVKTFLDDLQALGGRINNISVLGCGFSLADSKNKILTGLNGRENELEAIEIVKRICDKGVRVRLVIDDPEEVFFSDRGLDVQLLGGLWLAIANLNLISENFQAYLLLKTHIHDLVLNNTADLDKFPNSHTKICWEDETLKELIQQRIIYFHNIAMSEVDKFLWGDKAKKKEIENCYNYIFSNLRNGPRELITWLYTALEYNEELGKSYLDLNGLQSTINSLSKKSFQFFNSSNSEEFQDIGSFIQIIFENFEDNELTKKELTDHIREIQQSNKDFQNLERKNLWIQTTSSKIFTEIMFRIGAINLVTNKEIFPYMCDYNTDNLDLAKKVKLTPIFKYHLMNN